MELALILDDIDDALERIGDCDCLVTALSPLIFGLVLFADTAKSDKKLYSHFSSTLKNLLNEYHAIIEFKKEKKEDYSHLLNICSELGDLISSVNSKRL
jgi:hypothetical protein